MRRRFPVKMIRLVPGLAVPEYMGFLLEQCKPIKHSNKAIKAGHLLNIDYHPPYLQLQCGDVEKVVEEARRRGLRVYRGKKHITLTDGIYRARIYLSSTD
ncbi:MAG: hypothetical protein F7B18_07960 [Desulfurococcales archaeon]|nr:hypothetical protein [Desulfurococcales archaeon]